MVFDKRNEGDKFSRYSAKRNFSSSDSIDRFINRSAGDNTECIKL